MFTDTHCHIFNEYYDNINDVIKDASNNYITRYINNGTDLKSNQEVLELINKFPNMYGAIGIHPEVVDAYNKNDLLFIKDNLTNNKVVALGEIGLDYHYTKENKEEQIKLFEAQLSLAQDYNIPVIIHSREATQDTINCLKKYHVKGVIHSFSGSLETAKIYIKMGFLLGINGVITFKNSNLKDIIKQIPPENIVLETDSPYLTPEPYRGTKNEPKRVLEIAKFLCTIYKISLEELSEITNKNIKRIFDI